MRSGGREGACCGVVVEGCDRGGVEGAEGVASSLLLAAPADVPGLAAFPTPTHTEANGHASLHGEEGHANGFHANGAHANGVHA